MSSTIGPFRDDRTAAASRIEELEHENRALKQRFLEKAPYPVVQSKTGLSRGLVVLFTLLVPWATLGLIAVVVVVGMFMLWLSIPFNFGVH